MSTYETRSGSLLRRTKRPSRLRRARASAAASNRVRLDRMHKHNSSHSRDSDRRRQSRICVAPCPSNAQPTKTSKGIISGGAVEQEIMQKALLQIVNPKLLTHLTWTTG